MYRMIYTIIGFIVQVVNTPQFHKFHYKCGFSNKILIVIILKALITFLKTFLSNSISMS